MLVGRYEIVKERCMEIYIEEKRNIKSKIKSKKEVNDQFKRNMKRDVSESRNLWKEVGKVKNYIKIKDRTRRMMCMRLRRSIFRVCIICLQKSGLKSIFGFCGTVVIYWEESISRTGVE